MNKKLITCRVFLTILAITIFTSACAPRIEKDIIGKWESLDGIETIEFFENGTVIFTNNFGTTNVGDYSILDTDTIRVDIPNLLGMSESQVFTIALDKDLLILSQSGLTLQYINTISENSPSNQSRKTIVGTWQFKALNYEDFKGEWNINNDGTFSIEIDHDENYTGNVVIYGTYRFLDHSTLEFDSMECFDLERTDCISDKYIVMFEVISRNELLATWEVGDQMSLIRK